MNPSKVEKQSTGNDRNLISLFETYPTSKEEKLISGSPLSNPEASRADEKEQEFQSIPILNAEQFENGAPVVDASPEGVLSLSSDEIYASEILPLNENERSFRSTIPKERTSGTSSDDVVLFESSTRTRLKRPTRFSNSSTSNEQIRKMTDEDGKSGALNSNETLISHQESPFHAQKINQEKLTRKQNSKTTIINRTTKDDTATNSSELHKHHPSQEKKMTSLIEKHHVPKCSTVLHVSDLALQVNNTDTLEESKFCQNTDYISKITSRSRSEIEKELIEQKTVLQPSTRHGYNSRSGGPKSSIILTTKNHSPVLERSRSTERVAVISEMDLDDDKEIQPYHQPSSLFNLQMYVASVLNVPRNPFRNAKVMFILLIIVVWVVSFFSLYKIRT